jgi:DNA polymerase-3 subunit gamma/tau
MSAEVYYRKWRPRTFAELAGQDAVTRTLLNAVSTGKFAHAYLFSGPRGTGKTTAGRLLAKAVNCMSPKSGEPCNECANCQAYIEGRALDMIELDAASNRGIDEIRSLREKANFAPSGGENAYKVYLVDEVHMLTEPAFNALLKTLEEPPPHVIFVLATTEAHKVPATVISRCQRFDFRRITVGAMIDRLSYIASQEGLSIEPEAMELIARTATGSLRDAINLMEQLVDSYGSTVSFEQAQEGLGLVIDPRSADLARHAVQSDLSEGLTVISAVRDDGLDLRHFQRQVVTQLRALLLAKAGAAGSDTWSEDQLAVMSKVVSDVSAERIVAALHAFGEADLRSDPLSPLPLELALATTTLAKDTPETPATPPPAASTPRPAPRQAAPKPTGASLSEQRPVRPPTAPNGDAAPMQRQRVASPEAGERKVVAASPSANVDDLRERWQEIYQRAREIHYKAGALLNSGCGIIDAGEDEIVFGFRHKVMLDKIQGDGGENLRALQQAVDDVLGPGRTVRCVHDENADVQRPGRGGHLVRAAEELLSNNN